MEDTTMKRILAITAVFSLVCISASAYSRLLNFPRIGDRLTIDILDNNSVKTDSLLTTINLTSAKIISTERYSVWEPAAGDTLSVMLEITGREQKYLSDYQNTLFCITEIKPGYSRYYTYPKPYIPVDQSNTVYPVSSFGRAENVVKYASNGHSRINISRGGKVIISESDTLENVDHIHLNLSEKMIFGDSTVLHYSTTDRWYAPGYRYPVLSHQLDIMLTETRDTVDTNSKWIYISPDIQEKELTNDPLNENIRHDIKDPFRYNNPESGNNTADNRPTPPGIRWNADGTVLTVSQPGMQSGQYTQLILCDIQGRVFYTADFSGDDTELRIDVKVLNKGTYILYIATGGDPVTYRFII